MKPPQLALAAYVAMVAGISFAHLPPGYTPQLITAAIGSLAYGLIAGRWWALYGALAWLMGLFVPLIPLHEGERYEAGYLGFVLFQLLPVMVGSGLLIAIGVGARRWRGGVG